MNLLINFFSIMWKWWWMKLKWVMEEDLHHHQNEQPLK